MLLPNLPMPKAGSAWVHFHLQQACQVLKNANIADTSFVARCALWADVSKGRIAFASMAECCSREQRYNFIDHFFAEYLLNILLK